jgi:hypothetical protein
MRLLVKVLPPFAVLNRARVKPRSIIYAVIVHEVYFALSEAARRVSLNELGEAGSGAS